MNKFTLPVYVAQFEKIGVKHYLVKSHTGIFEAATSSIGHGVSKIHYTCPESHHTEANGGYPRIMSFARDPHDRYCALVTSCINEKQLRDYLTYFE